MAVHAARRARTGFALQDFLQAFRTCHGVVWRVLVEEHELSGRATLEAARPVMDYIDLAATRAGEAYVEAQQLLLAEGDRREPGSAARLAAARAAGLEPGTPCVGRRRAPDRPRRGRAGAARSPGP